MVFCGQCGYQLAPGDTTCPRCGTKTDVDVNTYDPGSSNPTEISHAILERASTQAAASPPQPRTVPPSWPGIGQAGGPLILGPAAPNPQQAAEPTSMMSAPAPVYAPQSLQSPQPQPAYPSMTGYPLYPQQPGTGGYGYPVAGGPGYQPYQTAAMEMLEDSRKGKITSLLLILFGLLFLTGAMVVFLLNQQGLIFAS